MLCAPIDGQYAELPSSASDAVLCSVLVRKMWNKNNPTVITVVNYFPTVITVVKF